jgi:hypothetical protein
MFFFPPSTFSTVSASQHTPFVYVSLLSTLRDVPWLCRNKRNILLSQFCIQREHNHCAPEQWWRCPVLTVGNSQTQKAIFRCVTSVINTQHLQFPYYQQPCCTFIHWHSHTNINPTTDSWTVTFPSLCTPDSSQYPMHIIHRPIKSLN